MKIKAIYLYLASLAWIAGLGLLLRLTDFNVTGLGITLTFLTMIFVPGVLLWRLSKLEVENLSIKLLYIIASGFGFYFLINLLGILFDLSVSQVLWTDIILVIILFSLAFWRDYQKIWEIKSDWFKTKSISDWFLIILISGLSVIAFLAVDAQSDKIVGDGLFHLAILEKVVSGVGLNPYNLWITKTDTINIIYSFPIWHILVGTFAKLLQINIFTAYSQIILPLVILALMVWYTFVKIIFRNNYLSTIGYLSFLAYFLSAGSFYALLPLRTPDSLVRLLIFPILLGLTCYYLFQVKSKILINLILISLTAIFMGLIHFTQLIDYFLILGVFLILFLIFSRAKKILKKFGLLILALIILILPYLGFFQIENIRQFLMANASSFVQDTFRNSSYHNTSIFCLYTVFALPIMLLFFKKEKRLIFFVSIPIALLLVTWQVFYLRHYFLKYLGEIFTVRAITDIPGYLFWGFLIFLIIFVLEYLLRKGGRIVSFIFYILATVFILVIFLATSVRNTLSVLVDETIFTPENEFFYKYFWLIFIIMVAISITIYFLFRYQKKELTIPEPKNKLNFAILLVLVFIILSLPYWATFTKVRSDNSNGTLMANRETLYFGNIPRIGGKETIEFLETLPSKSIIAASNVTNAQIILIYCNCYIFEYPYAIKDFTNSKYIYDPDISFKDRVKFLDNNSIDYVITRRSYETEIFESLPDDFEKVFENHFVYQVTNKGIISIKEGEFIVFRVLD